MTKYVKIAISLPLKAAEHARLAVERGRAESVSAYVADAIETKAKKESWREFFDELLAETGGPTTPAERREAERLLGIKKPRRRPVKKGSASRMKSRATKKSAPRRGSR